MISNSSVPADPAIDAHEIRKSAWSAADVAHKAFQSAEAALDVARANYNAAKSIADAACDIDLSSIDVSLKVNINAEYAAIAPKKPLPTPRGYMTSTWLSRRLSTKKYKMTTERHLTETARRIVEGVYIKCTFRSSKIMDVAGSYGAMNLSKESKLWQTMLQFA